MDPQILQLAMKSNGFDMVLQGKENVELLLICSDWPPGQQHAENFKNIVDKMFTAYYKYVAKDPLFIFPFCFLLKQFRNCELRVW